MHLYAIGNYIFFKPSLKWEKNWFKPNKQIFLVFCQSCNHFESLCISSHHDFKQHKKYLILLYDIKIPIQFIWVVEKTKKRPTKCQVIINNIFTHCEIHVYILKLKLFNIFNKSTIKWCKLCQFTHKLLVNLKKKYENTIL